jgi:hypothetical protein
MGNSYVTGYFMDDAWFGTNSLAGFGGGDVFLAKYDPAGEVLWVVGAGGTNEDFGGGVAVDGAGNSYITGYFSGTASFGSTNRVSLSAVGSSDIFVAKYDGSGNLLWVRQAGGTGADSGGGIAVDTGGNIYVSGSCKGCTTFGNLAKYDPNGSLVWSVGDGDNDVAEGVALDGNGSVYVAGIHYGNVGEAPTMFLDKYDINGHFLWHTNASGPGESDGYGIGLSPSGDVFVCGAFKGTVTWGQVTLFSQSGGDAFVARYDPSANLLWIKQLGGTNTFAEANGGVVGDSSGNCFIGGTFGDRLSSSVTNLVGVGVEDAFVAKYDAAGDLVWIVQIGGTNLDSAHGIAWSPKQGLYVTGVFSYSAVFGSIPLDSNGGGDMFLARIEELPILSVTNTADSVVVSWPTNVLGFTLEKATNSLPASQWSAVTNAVGVSGDRYVVTDQFSGSSSFYRLTKP